MLLKNDIDNSWFWIDCNEKKLSPIFLEKKQAQAWLSEIREALNQSETSKQAIHLKYPGVQRILVLIDVWQVVSGTIANQKKINMIKILDQIANDNSWFVYFNHSSVDMDPEVLKAVQKCQHSHVEDALQVYNDITQPVQYFFGGFHATMCLFDNHIGINKLFQIVPRNMIEFYILDDITGGLDVVKAVSTGALNDCTVEIRDMQYQPGSFSYSHHENEVEKYNLRLALVQNHLVTWSCIPTCVAR